MKRKIIALVCLFLIVITPFVSVFCVITATGLQYKDTYYAGLAKQYDRLCSVNQPKVIVVGGSNVAFGLDSQLFESLYGMPSVCFGLYGSFGVKVMMDLSKANINKGDVIIIAPETVDEGLSLYFGAESVLKGCEGRLDILSHIAFDNIGDILAASWDYATTKLNNKYTNEEFDLSGVYQNANINKYGEIDKNVFPREGNILATGYLQEPVKLETQTVTDEFVDYVNDYVDYCKLRGATVYYSFSPMNSRAIYTDDLRATCDNYYTYLASKLHCTVISDPYDYVYDYRYFYDTNFHLNDSGVVLRTAQLVADLKLEQGDSTPVEVTLPEPPQPIFQQKDIDMTLNYTDADLFEYKEEDGLLYIVGVKEEIKTMKEIVLPVVYDNKYVVSINEGTLNNLTKLEVVTVPVGYTQIDNGVFDGCTSLKKIRILEANPDNIAVFDNFLQGVPDSCIVAIVNGTASNFGTGYFWHRYVDYLVTGDN